MRCSPALDHRLRAEVAAVRAAALDLDRDMGGHRSGAPVRAVEGEKIVQDGLGVLGVVRGRQEHPRTEGVFIARGIREVRDLAQIPVREDVVQAGHDVVRLADHTEIRAQPLHERLRLCGEAEPTHHDRHVGQRAQQRHEFLGVVHRPIAVAYDLRCAREGALGVVPDEDGVHLAQVDPDDARRCAVQGLPQDLLPPVLRRAEQIKTFRGQAVPCGDSRDLHKGVGVDGQRRVVRGTDEQNVRAGPRTSRRDVDRHASPSFGT